MYTIELFDFIETWFLNDLSWKLKEANGEDLSIQINSGGGSLFTALSAYSLIRDYAEKHNAIVETIAIGECASAATIIFLAGNKDFRFVNEFTQPFVHNANYDVVSGDHNDLRDAADDLEEASNLLAKFYSKTTLLSFEQAKALMEKETWLTPEECVEIGFASSIKYATPIMAKRIRKINNRNKNQNQKVMSKKRWKSPILNRFFGITNKVVYTADRVEVDFPDLEDDATPKVGDKATIDGEAANGEHVMADGNKYVFADGVLDEIIEGDGSEVEEVIDEIVDDLVEKVEEIVEMVEELKDLPELIIENKRMKVEIKNLKERISGARGKGVENKRERDKKDVKGKKATDVKTALNNLKNRKNK